ncbi:diguanylate cyclase domain-containing protein [Tepidibacter formicigenes]|jgi:diguanylate cyclase (GGDEF)-like protein|uniref:Diguanylate cyclase (GGDEF) domain-containing protein n=1 Tax=Tepidibacter formicigenes DSM 15518 TaxID=1123349 RepID=A0A1M6S8W4_9FIRM|nr:diguanylate cyclase [Tepidibacter formicigenes]SHK41183.1 diguanylate cyclase (GGDEF) domain-containing protein [Tepidibacter formicigenes DSM 15518]
MKVIRDKKNIVFSLEYMKLYKKTFNFFGLISIVMIIFVYFISHIVILGNFENLEKKETYKAIKQVVNALEKDFFNLSMTNKDYAAWDETYDFVQGKNPDYIEKNLMDETFIINKLNVFILINKEGNIVYKKGFDLVNYSEISVSDSLIKQINKQSPLLNFSKPTRGITGIISLPEGKMMISSHPVVTDYLKGPINGILIIGRYIDSNKISQLSQQTNLSIELEELNEYEIPKEVKTLRNPFINKSSVWVENINKNHIYGYSIIYDIYENPALILKIDKIKYIYNKGYLTFIYFLGIILFVYIIFFIASCFYMNKIIYKAHYDALTNLPNRHYFYDKSEELLIKAFNNNEKIAVFFIDLDNFKNINDYFGHYVGDVLLQHITKRLKDNIDKESIISRLGGDEFIIFIPNIEDVKAVEKIAQNIINCTTKPFFIKENKIFISMSIGISIYPFDGDDVNTLINNADIAMYNVKKEAKNGYKFYKKNIS